LIAFATGLLLLAEVDEGRWGNALLKDVQQHQDQQWLPPYEFSFGVPMLPGEAALPCKLSLTTRPAFTEAKVLAVGPAAMSRWRLLTGVPHERARRPVHDAGSSVTYTTGVVEYLVAS
jgi:hypothetical protein